MAKTVLVEFYALQYRRVETLKRMLPLNLNFFTREMFDTREEAEDRLTYIKQQPGAHLFEWRIRVYQRQVSKAIT